jgi:pimeloyl-ACP methyl ester carboxylesterase
LDTRLTAAIGHRAGDGPSLVLLHGGASSWHEFAPLLPHLEARRDVIAVAAPGHIDGPTADSTDAVTVAAFVDAFERLLDDLGLGVVDVAGHSFGGWHALELARRGRARTAVAIAPAGGWTQQDAAVLEARFAARFIPRASRTTGLMRTLGRSRAGRRAILADTGSRGIAMTADDLAAFAVALGRWPLQARLHEFLADGERYRTADDLIVISAPVLLLWGQKDKIIPLRHSRHFLDQLPSAVFKVVEGVGHFPQFDEPVAIAAEILQFTDAHGPDGTRVRQEVVT